MYTILFTIILSLLWLFYKYVEVQQRNIQEKILNLYIGNIETDIEQVIEKTASLSGQKLLLNNRYIRNIGSSATQDILRYNNQYHINLQLEFLYN